jgi:hypothetical protein
MPGARAYLAGSAGSSVPISPQFWGLNIEPTHPFAASDALRVNATPVQYLRYPSGNYAEQMNYTSSLITLDTGVTETAVNTVADFVASCSLIHCRAIMELPVEINSTSTVAYYVSYVVQTLGFQPAYWEIGNAPASWKHFGAPWSTWANSTTGNLTPVPFANEARAMIGAIRSIDPSTPIVALGSGMVPPYDQAWIGALLRIDGSELAGISVHDYPGWTGNSSSTLTDFFAALNATWALPKLISSDQAYMSTVCPSCSTRLFVTEANANYGGGTFDALLGSFNDTLFLAAEVTQTLRAHAPNIDWFDYSSNYPGTWIRPGASPGTDYYLFSDLLTRLGNATLAGQPAEPAGLFSVGTTGPLGESFLAVNVNTATSVSVNLTSAGFAPGGSVTEGYWGTGASRAVDLQVRSDASILLPPLSLALFSSWNATSSGGSPERFPVTFTEQGLPAGTPWTVNLAGAPLSSTVGQITFLELNGSYGYTVAPVATFTVSPSQGNVSVTGAGITTPIQFAAIAGPSPLGVTMTATPGAIQLGDNVTYAVQVTGGTPPYAFAYAALPPGCTTANDSTLTCHPSHSGNYTANVTVHDTGGARANAAAEVSIQALPPVQNRSPPRLSTTSPAASVPPWILLGIVAAESALAIWGAIALLRRPRSGR